MKSMLKPWLLASLTALSALGSGAALAATPYVSATVQGALTPGVYGRIDIGNAPPPPLIYAQPVIIQRAPVLVQQPPLYLHVPPGHAKKWSKHCARYNACGQPVYFVRVRGDDDYEARRNGGAYFANDQGGHKEKFKYKDRDKGHGKKHGKGRDD